MSDHTKLPPTPTPNLTTPGTLPAWGVALAATGIVLTAHTLGVAWLREPVLGAPAGLWAIGLLVGIFSAPARKRIASLLERTANFFGHSTAATELAAETDPGAGWWPRNRVGAVCLDAATRLAAILVRIAWLPLWGGEVSLAGDARRRVERWLGSLSLPTRPLRVGICMPDEEAEALVAAAGPSRVEWFRLASWEDPQSACRRHLFDAAVFHDGEGPVRIVTLERPGQPAGVVEWADLVGELTFAKLFPSRVDPAAVVIEGATRTRVREGADLLRALVESAATLARCEPRISLADRVLGRRATDMVERPAGLALWRSPRSVAAGVIAHLVRTAGEHAETWPEAASIAADAGSAFLIAAEDLNPTERHAGLLSASTSAAAGATAALRLGAACIGALHDDEGMECLVRADKLLRDGSTPLAKLDHAAFLESELAHGSGDPMSVGRAAAGICLVCAAAEPQRVSFLRDDMLEEMAYAGWLVGRDQDRGLLIRVFLEIEHAHGVGAQTPIAKKRRRTAPATKPANAKATSAKAASPKAAKSAKAAKPSKSKAA
ncbi:MAG: hypothetical protein IT431_02010 [Phycisphaerales bacterium]|nr:hypothetical protein [Phycisphaerales bacterium]